MTLENGKAQEANRWLATAIEQAGEAIVITDPEGVIQYVNPAFERTTGYAQEEAVGQNPRILKSGQQDPAFYQDLWDTIKRGAVWQGRMKNKKKDGSLYDELNTISPVRDAAGTTINFVAIKRDITREVTLEHQLRHSQKMEAIGQLAGGVAHDFNNILQVITGYSGMLASALVHEGALYEDLVQIQTAAERASALTRQLLAFSRRQALQPLNLDLNELIGNLLKMLRRLIGENINLTFVSSDSLSPIYADPNQVEQILTNLCVNARDAMPDGGQIRIETRDVRLSADYGKLHAWARSGHFVMIGVTDTGAGMEKEVLQKIFDPFFTTKEVGKGTGLGLAMVYGLVKQHQGCIHVYSEVGLGTTFKIYLPATQAEAEPPSTAALEPIRGGQETILVAEDDEPLREMVKRVLAGAGYTVLLAPDGLEALRIFQTEWKKISLALLDVVMPSMDGRMLHDEMKKIDPHVRILFSSGYAPDIVHTRFVLGRGPHLIQKPYNTEDLLRRVREMLDAQT